jgi:hypothetical protein
MRITFGKIFGIILAIIGFFYTIFDIWDWVEIGQKWPNIIPDTADAVRAHASFMVISILLSIAGFYIYRKS